MTAFTQILDEIEASTVDEADFTSFSSRLYRAFEVRPPESDGRRAPGQSEARKMYAAAFSPPKPRNLEPNGRPATVAAAPNLATLLDELRDARRSLPKLKALRRDIARRCHPDLRRMDPRATGLLAEMNARIDVAIKECLGSAAAK